MLFLSRNPPLIKRECIDFCKKRATKNASLKTCTKNVLCGSTKKLNSKLVKDFLSLIFFNKMKNETLNRNIRKFLSVLLNFEKFNTKVIHQ